MPPTTIVAAVLTLASVALAFSAHRANGASGAIVAGLLGVTMLSTLLVPGFPRIVAATAAFVLLIPTAALGHRRQTQETSVGRNRESERSAIGLQLVDTFFMAATMLLMPAMNDDADERTGSAAHAPMSGMRHTLSSSSILLIALILWAFCVATIAVPALRAREKLDVRQVLHSCGMLAAIAVASA